MRIALARISIIAIVLVFFVVPILLFAWFILTSYLLESLATSMVPPLYPSASYETDVWDGGSSYQSKGKVYVIKADIQKVRDWMNAQSPGFSKVTSEITWASARQRFASYKRCNQGVVARVLTRLELGPADFGELFPCASVWLSADISSTAQTTMTVWVGYPSR